MTFCLVYLVKAVQVPKKNKVYLSICCELAVVLKQRRPFKIFAIFNFFSLSNVMIKKF
jgi:hypothetical protein